MKEKITYIAIIEKPGMIVSYVECWAFTHKEAYVTATALLKDGELLRGVVEADQ